jgi:hypothetical protein
MIDVQGIKVTGEASKENDVAFCYGAPWTLPFITDDEIVKCRD